MSEVLIEQLIEIGDNFQDDDWEWAKGYDDGIKAAINIVEEFFKESKLNPNQEQVLGWLKTGHCDGDSVFEALERITYVYEDPKTEEALESLSPDQEVQVIATFMQWALEQEEE